MIEKLKEQWLGVVAVVIIFILGVVYAYVGTDWGGWGLLTAFGVGALVVACSFFVYWATHTERVMKELKRQIKIFQELYAFLIPDEQLMEIERSAGQVWVMTPDLYYESAEPDWRKVVYENIERGVHYIYFIEKRLEPKFNQFRTELEKFLQAKNNTIATGQIEVIFMDMIVPTEIVFYNPNSDKPMGFVVSPIEGAKTNMRMSSNVRDRVLALLKAHVKG